MQLLYGKEMEKVPQATWNWLQQLILKDRNHKLHQLLFTTPCVLLDLTMVSFNMFILPPAVTLSQEMGLVQEWERF